MNLANDAITNQLSDSFKRLFRQLTGPHNGSAGKANGNGNGNGAAHLRQSKGLREFWSGLRTPEGLHVLDFGAVSQANINFITGLGHRLRTEDLYRSLSCTSVSCASSPEESQKQAGLFLEGLNYPEGQFDGVLGWDLFDFLEDPYVKPLVDRLHQLLKPGGSLLAFFHAGQPGQALPMSHYHICAQDQLQVLNRGEGKLRRSFNNRAIEALFQQFSSLKFFLTRDSLREVIVIR
jgi:hypothetical protein